MPGRVRLRRGRRCRRDDGAVTAMLVFPLAALSFMLCVHAAIVFHARDAVAGAAQDGLRAAQIEDGTSADATAASNEILRLAPALMNASTSVSLTDGGDTITVTVTAQVRSVVPGLGSDVRSVATGPRERFYTEDERS